VDLYAHLESGRIPDVLLRRYQPVNTVFGYRSADHYTGPRCGRCNRLEHDHLWQLVDPDVAEQEGVIDCEVRP